MTHTDSSERRRFTRIEFDAQASIQQDDQYFDVKLLDISLNGALVETHTQHSFNDNATINLKIVLADEALISMETQLAHHNHHELGLRCASIDMESISHLRRLIELNDDDAHASERILEELIQPLNKQ